MQCLLYLLVCGAVQNCCLADLYQVNRTRTLCYSDVAEFICSQHVDSVAWRVINGFTPSAYFIFYAPSPITTIKSSTIDSTPVTVQLIFGNSTFFNSSLTIVATLSVTIQCNSERITYHPLDRSQVVPSEITLTPTTSGSSSYTITWSSSYYNSSEYMIIVYPPEFYTQEHLIINTDNSTVYNITVALKYCPNRIYSTFTFSCRLVNFPEVLHYEVRTSGDMSVYVSSYIEKIQCTNNTWGGRLLTSTTTQDEPVATYTAFHSSTSKNTASELNTTTFDFGHFMFASTSYNLSENNSNCNSLSIILSVVGICLLTIIIHIILITVFMTRRKIRSNKPNHERSRYKHTGDQEIVELKRERITTNKNEAYSTFLLNNSLPVLTECDFDKSYEVPIFKRNTLSDQDTDAGDSKATASEDGPVLPPKLPPRTISTRLP